MFLCSIDYYKDLACYGYKRECQDFQKILQLLNSEDCHQSFTPPSAARTHFGSMAFLPLPPNVSCI